MVNNFTYQIYNYLMDDNEHASKQSLKSGAILLDMVTYNCHIYYGSYYVRSDIAFSPEFNYATQVICKCPGK